MFTEIRGSEMFVEIGSQPIIVNGSTTLADAYHLLSERSLREGDRGMGILGEVLVIDNDRKVLGSMSDLDLWNGLEVIRKRDSSRNSGNILLRELTQYLKRPITTTQYSEAEGIKALKMGRTLFILREPLQYDALLYVSNVKAEVTPHDIRRANPIAYVSPTL